MYAPGAQSVANARLALPFQGQGHVRRGNRKAAPREAEEQPREVH